MSKDPDNLSKKLEAYALLLQSDEAELRRVGQNFHSKKSSLGVVLMMLSKIKSQPNTPQDIQAKLLKLSEILNELLDDFYKIHMDITPRIAKRGGLLNMFSEKSKKGSLWPNIEVITDLHPFNELGFGEFEEHLVYKLCLDWLRYFEALGYQRVYYCPEFGNGVLLIKMRASALKSEQDKNAAVIAALRKLTESRALVCGAEILPETNWNDVAQFKLSNAAQTAEPDN